MTIDPYYQQQNVGTGNIRCMRIFAGVPSFDSGVVDDGNFGDLGGYFFGNFRDEGQQYYMTIMLPPCRPVIDC